MMQEILSKTTWVEWFGVFCFMVFLLFCFGCRVEWRVSCRFCREKAASILAIVGAFPTNAPDFEYNAI